MREENRLITYMTILYCVIVALALLACVGNIVRGMTTKEPTISENVVEPIASDPIVVETEVSEPVEETNLSDIIRSEYAEEITYLAKLVYGEARGCSVTEQSAVIWCVLNRVDAGYSYLENDIIGVITQKNQFTGYRESNPATDEHTELAVDVLTRWVREKNGETDVGRTLPSGYCWFRGDGQQNHFRNAYKGDYDIWDWSLPSPYEA